MAKYLLIRVAGSVAVFFVIAVCLFLLVRAAPGDPVDMMVPPGEGGNQAFIEQRRHELGLDRPLPVQFAAWFGALLQGDLGFSYSTRLPVTELLLQRLGPTVLLMGSGIALGLAVAIPAGVIAAVRRNRLGDYVVSAGSLVAICIPSFFLGMVAIYVFSLQLQWFPSSGMSTPGDGGPVDILRHLVLPVVILGLGAAGPLTRYVRSGMLDELSADYIRTVTAKGASQRVVLGHAIRNSLLPLITVVMLFIPKFLAGAVVIEQIFAWPGMGQLSITAITARDYPVIIGFGLYVAVLVLVCNLLADLAYSVADPRVRLS